MTTSRITALPTHSRRQRASCGPCRLVSHIGTPDPGRRRGNANRQPSGRAGPHPAAYRPQTGPPSRGRHGQRISLGRMAPSRRDPTSKCHPSSEHNANRRPNPRRTTSQRRAQPTPPHSPRCERTTPAPRPTSARNAPADARPRRSQETRSAPRPAPRDGSLGRSATRPGKRSRVVGVVGRQQQCDELQQLCAISRSRPPHPLGSTPHNQIKDPRDRTNGPGA